MLPPEEKRIIKYLGLIKQLIYYSEKDGTRGVKSHAALFRGQYLDCLQVANSLKAGQNSKYRSKLEIGVHSNTTVFELRRLVGEHAARIYEGDSYIQNQPVHPSLIRLFRAVGCLDIKETENGKTLGELKFKRNELLTAYRRSVYGATKAPLLNFDKTDLSERARQIFTEWFITCSELEDPMDPNSRRLMGAQGALRFIREATDEEVRESDRQLTSMFEAYDQDRDGFLELEDFLSFWRASIFEKEEVVRGNLATYGYRYDLRRHPVDGMDINVMQLRQSTEDMPRLKFASTPAYFESLFDLMADTEVATACWSVLKTASTNPALYRKVLNLDREPGFTWSDIFQSDNIHKMLYVLQIVEALLEESAHEDSEWVKRFLLIGGFQEILNMFRTSLSMIGQAESLTKFEKNFLEQMLKLIKIFVLAAFAVEGDYGDNDVYEVI